MTSFKRTCVNSFIATVATVTLALLPSVFGLSTSRAAAPSTHLEIAGENLVDGMKLKLTTAEANTTVVVFLSAICPCSNSHIKELKALAQEHPKVRFVGVHSNANEARELSEAYFKKANLPFPVIEDEKFKLANEFGALKTPHTFVLNSQGEIIYRGGVSNSHDVERSDRKFLREALSDLANGQKVRTTEGRALGCAISRG